DQLLSVDGRAVHGWPDMPKGDGPFKMIFKGKGPTPITLSKETPSFSTPDLSREIETEFASLKRSLSELKESVKAPSEGAEEAGEEIGRLYGAIKSLLDRLKQERDGHFRHAREPQESI